MIGVIVGYVEHMQRARKYAMAGAVRELCPPSPDWTVQLMPSAEDVARSVFVMLAAT